LVIIDVNVPVFYYHAMHLSAKRGIAIARRDTRRQSTQFVDNKLQLLLSQELVKLRISNLARTITGSIRTKAH